MEIGLLIILFLSILGVLYFRQNKQTPKLPDGRRQSLPRQRKLKMRLPPPQESETFILSAERLAEQGRYDDAATLYLQAGKIFLAAKTKMMKGPEAATEALDIIRSKMPNSFETIGRNLAHEFYYNLRKPVEAATILRAMGLVGEAEAIEVVENIPPTERYLIQSEMEVPIQNENVNQVTHQPESSILVSEQLDQVEKSEMQPEKSEMEPAKAVATTVDVSGEIPNTILTAKLGLEKPCVVCKKSIDAGSEYVYCLNCGNPGHRRHLLEYIKVRGICPNCKARLTRKMYEE